MASLYSGYMYPVCNIIDITDKIVTIEFGENQKMATLTRNRGIFRIQSNIYDATLL